MYLTTDEACIDVTARIVIYCHTESLISRAYQVTDLPILNISYVKESIRNLLVKNVHIATHMYGDKQIIMSYWYYNI